MNIKSLSILTMTSQKKITFLIPSHLMEQYQNITKNKGKESLLESLLFKFRQQKSIFITKKWNASTLIFQESNLNLQRVDCRLKEIYLIKLKLLAQAHNMSMCAFFTLLLTLEIAGAWGDEGVGGVPPKPRKITLKKSLTFKITPIFRCIFHFKV